ncbi:hypothetical protein BHM03_00006271 [Ensete ventricosum]|nr:hypothetical protein BHM03_00006271 [Ensete ventricosum]
MGPWHRTKRQRTSLRPKRTEWPRARVHSLALPKQPRHVRASAVHRQRWLDRVQARTLESDGVGVRPSDQHSRLWGRGRGMLYILRTKVEVSPRLGAAHVHMDARGFFVGAERCASSSTRRLVNQEPERSPRAGVNFWSLVELQSLGVHCDVPRGVAYLWSGNLVWLASVGKASLFASASFRSSVGSSIVDACTKAAVGG